MKDAVAYDLERKELSENIGFGINKLMSWKTLTRNDVTIRNERDYVMVTLHLNSDVAENVAENVAEKLTVRQKRILSLIRENHKISASKIAEILLITSRTTQRDLTVLKEKNIIKRVGPDKGGHWEIIHNAGIGKHCE